MGRFAALLVLLVLTTDARSAPVLLDTFHGPRPTGPDWTYTGPSPRWDHTAGRLSVTGTGEDSLYWRRPMPALEPGRDYCFRYRVRRQPGSSEWTVIAGLDCCNRDAAATADWQENSFVFRTPADVRNAFARLGQWHLKGGLEFARVEILPVQAVHSRVAGITLGTGESVDHLAYRFAAPLDSEGANSSRPLLRHSAPFNSNRWVFTGGAEVIYRHAVGDIPQASASVEVRLNNYLSGDCVVDCGTDGKTWTEAARITASGKVPLPSHLFPARVIYVRLRGDRAQAAAGNSAPGSFQVDGYGYSAVLSRSAGQAAGTTTYFQADVSKPVAHIDAMDGAGSEEGSLRGTLSGLRGNSATLALTLSGVPHPRTYTTTIALKPAGETAFRIPFTCKQTGSVSITVRVVGPDGRVVETLRARQYVPSYMASDYGYPLKPMADSELWWCESTYKVAPGRAAPSGAVTRPDLTMYAARREREHVQLVLRPRRDVGPITVTATPLVSPRATIPASAIELREVAYIPVTTPSDSTGVAGDWPDPLPPLRGNWRPRSGRNNPLWITVTVPGNAAAGDYRGAVVLTTGSRVTRVPVRVHVWGFSLPRTTGLRSGFGLSAGSIRQYHNLKTADQVKRVWDMYMVEFARRRIAPYDPMALDPYTLSLEGATWIGGTPDTQSVAEGAYSRKVVDDQATSVIDCHLANRIAITPGKRYLLTWKCRTAEAGQEYEVCVGSNDAAGDWIPYHNIDLRYRGTGQWQAETVDITERIPADARSVSLGLRPAVWTEDGRATGTAWFDAVDLLEGDEHRGLVADAGFERQGSLKVRLDFTEFDKAGRRYIDGLGFNAFTVAVPGLGGGRYPSYDHGSILGYASGTPEYETLMADFGRQLEAHLAKMGWLHKAYVYWYDEPEVSDYPFVQEGMAKLSRYTPHLKRMLTEEIQPELAGRVQLWCPLTPNFSRAPMAARQRLGDEAWWYVCTGPKAPYAGLFIDHPAVEMRVWLWQTWMNAVQGILVWETTYWTSPQQFSGTPQNPWTDAMSYVAGPDGVWGNGDGRFFYPPNRLGAGDTTTPFVEPPVVSMRWEMLGAGVQDWEYFTLLRPLVTRCAGRGDRSPGLRRARALLTVPPSVCRDMTHFSVDPQPLLAHRLKVGAAIEQLSARAPR